MLFPRDATSSPRRLHWACDRKMLRVQQCCTFENRGYVPAAYQHRLAFLEFCWWGSPPSAPQQRAWLVRTGADRARRCCAGAVAGQGAVAGAAPACWCGGWAGSAPGAGRAGTGSGTSPARLRCCCPGAGGAAAAPAASVTAVEGAPAAARAASCYVCAAAPPATAPPLCPAACTEEGATPHVQ